MESLLGSRVSEGSSIPFFPMSVGSDVDFGVSCPSATALDSELERVSIEDIEHSSEGKLPVEIVEEEYILSHIEVPPFGGVLKESVNVGISMLLIYLSRLSNSWVTPDNVHFNWSICRASFGI